MYRSKLPQTLKSYVYFQRLCSPCETLALGVLGGKMIKEGIWKILLRNDRLQKSRVRRFKKQLERLNNSLGATCRLSGESCTDVRLDEVENILESRGLDCVPFQSVMRETKVMKTFYTSEFNHKGRPGKMTMTMWLKLMKHLVTFLRN